MKTIVKQFVALVREGVGSCSAISAAYYNSFEFTTTGNNLCHARTLGIMVAASWKLPGACAVDIDLRLNTRNGVKFQPDLRAVDRAGEALLFADFESPNSSDARVPVKDVQAFMKWCAATKCRSPYVIFTSLPRIATSWGLRWTSNGQWNADHAKNRDQIQARPFDYWYRYYRKAVSGIFQKDLQSAAPVYFVNFDGTNLDFVPMSRRSS